MTIEKKPAASNEAPKKTPFCVETSQQEEIRDDWEAGVRTWGASPELIHAAASLEN